MKIRILIPILAACSGLLAAEPPAPEASPSASPGTTTQPGGQWRDKMLRKKMQDNVPPDIRKRFEAVREKALQDPKIQELKKKADAASEEFLKAMREAMMKADPGLADIVKERFGGEKMKDGKMGEFPGFANLSESDRQKLMAAREKAKDDPSVKAAEAAKTNAKTPEERRAATEEFHKSMKEALLKADPTIGPILDQLKTPATPQKPQGTKPTPQSET